MVLNKHPFLPVALDMQARGVCRELPLEFLTREDVDRYLALEFPDHRFPGQFASLIYTKTEGNPLFMTDVVRYLRSKKVIGESEGRWALVQTVPEIETDFPETVRSMIQRKSRSWTTPIGDCCLPPARKAPISIQRPSPVRWRWMRATSKNTCKRSTRPTAS